MEDLKAATVEALVERIAEVKHLLTGFDSRAVYGLLQELGARNTGTSDLELAQYDPDKPFHQVSCGFVSAENILSNADLAPFGPAAHPHFTVIPPAWQAHEDLMRFLAGEMSMPEGGRNFTLVTNHSNVIDIALVLGGLRLSIDRWLNPETFSRKSTLIISRGITTTNVKLHKLGVILPTVETIQLFANTAFSFPTTPTVRRRQRSFPEGLVALANELVKLELELRLRRGGHLLAIAPSASKDVFLSDKVHMQPLQSGTMQMMRGWVIPVAITLDHDEFGCRVLSPELVTSDAQCHAIMHSIAKECHRQTLVPHEYHEQSSKWDRVMESVRAL